MNIRDFSGGLNKRIHPTLIRPTESVIYNNCDNEQGVLVPIADSKDTDILVDNYWYHSKVNDTILSNKHETYWLDYLNDTYSIGVSGAYKIRDNITTSMTMLAPINTLRLEEAEEDVGNLDGVYIYCYTLYNNEDGTESAPSPLSEVTLIKGKVSLSGFDNNDDQTTHYRIYRIGGDLIQYTLVDTIDITSVTYLDNNSDYNISGNHILDTIGADFNPSAGNYLIIADAMLFTAYEDKVYYSDVGRPTIWRNINFISFDDTVTGIGATQNGILVFTKCKTYIVTGNSPSTFSKYLLDGEQGCISNGSIQFIDGNLIWLSSDGICSSNGGKVTVISIIRMGKINLIGVLNAVVHDRIYYLSHDGGMLLVDFRYNMIIRTSSDKGILGIYNNRIHTSYKGKLIELLAGTAKYMYYKSPMFTEGAYTVLKNYKDLYIAYQGDIRVRAYIYTSTKMVKVLDKKLDTTLLQYNLKTLSDYDGYALSFIINGTGSVFEINYTTHNREK